MDQCRRQNIVAFEQLQDDQSKLVTLYEVGYDPSKFGDIPILENNQKPIVHFVKGLEIKLWVEKDLLMASVRP
ncbi:MAG: hypothetical protein MI867_29340 [Pseudomonadales bacterium]|nr:hypothetical protein [Pseudomonadales bacterium]